MPGALFDAAEEASGPGRHPGNNASGWLADTFAPAGTDRLGRSLQRVTADTWRQQFSADAMAAALELARFGITANMVQPPVTDTGWVSDAVRDAVAASPLFHVASPAEVAEVVVCWPRTPGPSSPPT